MRKNFELKHLTDDLELEIHASREKLEVHLSLCEVALGTLDERPDLQRKSGLTKYEGKVRAFEEALL